MAAVVVKEKPTPACLRCKLVQSESMYAFDKRPCGCPEHIAPDWVMILDGFVFRKLINTDGFTFGTRNDMLGTREELGL